MQYQSEEVGQAFLRKGGKLLSLGIRDLESVTLKTFDEIQRGMSDDFLTTDLLLQGARS